MKEFAYDARFKLYFGHEAECARVQEIAPPDFEASTSAYAAFVRREKLSFTERLAVILALVPHVLKTGKADLKFFSVSGDVQEPGVHEVKVGTTLRDLVDLCGGLRDGKKLVAFLPGGPSTTFMPGDSADVVSRGRARWTSWETSVLVWASASGIHQAPSANWPAMERAATRARWDLPIPPGPGTV